MTTRPRLECYSYETTGQGVPVATGHQEKQRTDSPPNLQEKGPANTWISDFGPPKL